MRTTGRRRALAVLAVAFWCCLAANVKVLAAGAGATSPDGDLVECGYRKRVMVSPTSNEAFIAWLDRYASTRWSIPMTPTAEKDRIHLDFSASKNFVGHVGGGGGSRAVYDPRHHLLALCQVYDTAQGFFVFENVPAPPFSVARGYLAGFATGRGVRLGSTVAEVKRVYGPAAIVHFEGSHYGLSYQRLVPVAGPRTPPTYSPLGIYTWFDIVNGRVASIGRLTGF